MSRITPGEFADALRDYLGDRVKFMPGWQHATTAGGFNPNGVMHHWTAMSGKDWHPHDQNQVLRHGYSTLPGPLCHASPARNGDLWVIGWGNCNHAGSGDSRVLRLIQASDYRGQLHGTREDADGNVRFYGLEYQYHPSDGPMPEEQYEAGVLAAAAICDAHGWSPAQAQGSNLDHYEWAARKWDRERDNLADRTRADVRRAMEGDFGGIDMASARDIARAVWNFRLPLPGRDGETRAAKWVLSQAWNRAGDNRTMIRDLARALSDPALSDAERQALAQDVAERVEALEAAEVAEALDITTKE